MLTTTMAYTPTQATQARKQRKFADQPFLPVALARNGPTFSHVGKTTSLPPRSKVREKVLQLLECCDEHLRRDLIRTTGGSLSNRTEEQVMAAIKKLAVRQENTMVARVQLHNMKQDIAEPIRNFCARLRGQAGVCKFTVTCTNCDRDVDYTEHMIRDVVTRGLADNDIQLDLLGDQNQNMTSEEVIKFIEAKESGKRSAGHLLETQATNATGSHIVRTNRKI